MKKKLISLFFLVSVAFARNLIHDGEGLSSNTQNTCQTTQCKIAADIIMKGMNRSADPCEDFYEYACGGWPTNFTAPEVGVEWNIDEMVQQEINEMKRRILEQEIQSNDTEPLKLQKKLYKSCMDLESIKKVGLEPLMKTINDIGGWPLIMEPEEWNSEKYSWQDVHAYYANITGTHFLFSLDIDADLTNSAVNILYVDQPDSNLFSHQAAAGNDVFNLIFNYTLFTFEVAKLLASSQNTEVDMDELTDFLDFGVDLLNIAVDEEERQDYERWLNYMTIEELQKFYNNIGTVNYTSNIDWFHTLQSFLSDANVIISESEPIILREPGYLKNLAELLDKTPNKTIVNYIHWMYILSMSIYSDENLCNTAIKMFHLINDPEQMPERWEICIALDPIEVGTSYEFVKRNITNDTIKEVKDVAENIRTQLAIDIENSNWMDEETKAKNVEKVNSMEVHVAYPKWYNNLTEFNHYLDGLHVGSNLYENALDISLYMKRRNFEDLRKPYDKNEWKMEPTVSNAYYIHSSNSLTILAAEITLPIFGSSLPKAVNYGSVGFMNGHEMAHGFDANGCKFNKDGNLEPWWPKAMVKIYEKKVECIVEQFDNYTANGNLTNNENTADNLGLNAAFGAYKRLLKNNQDKRLPGLDDITPDQLFFISFANNFCSISKEDTELNADVHSVPSVRINGGVTNIESFTQAYQCKSTAPKCSIWK